MVATARLTAGLSGLRNRNTRVTNKTQLHVVRGNIEADPIILDDDEDEKNRVLASQGVDEEDANEHHLQAALFASSQRTLSTTQIKPQADATDSNAFIPTPDAAGLVADYTNLYLSGQFKLPATHLRFSDSIDESCIGGLAGSYSYFLDERDAEWLARNNGAAKGEGTSTSGGGAAVNGTPTTNNPLIRGAPRTPHPRSTKGKGKEPEHLFPGVVQQPSIVIDENQFELIMGLFEKWTDESVSPYLHLASDPEHFPDFNNYYNSLAAPLPPSTFSNFQVPSDVPAPEQMVPLARVIYPWWKERRMEQKGHRIVPQLHVLILEAQEKEDKTGGSPYTCFRKRDVKPMRKTRTNNITHTERLTRLRGELQSSLELAQMVLKREKIKRESVAIGAEVWRTRESLAEYMKQLNGAAPGSVPPTDELLLIDRERKPRKPKIEATGSGRIILAANRRPSHVRGAFSDSLDPHSPLALNGDTSHAFEECQRWPSARTAGIQREVERDLNKARKDDAYWEDLVDMPYQSISLSAADKFFKPLPPSDGTMPLPSSSTSVNSAMQGEDLISPRLARSVRLRTGRGGRLHLDRRSHAPKPHRLLQREWAGYPPRADDVAAAQLHAERWVARNWRPRDTGVRLGRRERKLGEEYWAHPRLHDSEHPDYMRVDDAVRGDLHREAQDTTFGFEQSSCGWDTRELWGRARPIRDEEGWKPTPHLAVDPEGLGMEIAMRNAGERQRAVETWRGKTADSTGGGGGALALFTDGDAMVEGSEQFGRRREQDDDVVMEPWTRDDEADEMERAWKLEERWRYDSETSGFQGNDMDDRFLLDDYQSKFLRISTTLLDAQDHETIKTDPQLLVPLPPKQDRYLDHQLRMQPPGLPQLSSSASATTSATPTPPHSLPLRQIPLSSRSVSSPSPMPMPNGTGVHSQSLSVDPPTSQNPTSHPLTNGNIFSNSTSNGNGPRPIPQPPPKTNGVTVLGGARPPPDSTAAIRVNTSFRTKQAHHGVLSHTGLSSALGNGMTNGHGDTAVNGAFPSKPYPSLKTTLDRVNAAQQNSQQQQPGRPYQTPVPSVMNGDHATISMPLGVGNLQLKLPTQRSTPTRTNGARDAGSLSPENASTRQPVNPYALTHTQHLSLPQLPSTSTRTV